MSELGEVTQSTSTVNAIKNALSANGLSCTDEDLANLVRKDRLIKDIKRLIDEGHTRAEIDKTVKQILAENAKREVN